MWVRQELRSRYYQTRLGPLWLIAQPLLMTLVFTIAFTIVARIGSRGVPYPVFFLVGYELWNYFSYCVGRSNTVIAVNQALITHHKFPRELLVLSILLSALPDLAVGSVFVGVLMLFYEIGIGAMAWMLIPIVILLVLFTLGTCLWIATVAALVRDVGALLPSFVRALFYLSPVIYSVVGVPGKLKSVYLANPLAGFIVAARDVLFEGKFAYPTALLAAGVVALVAASTGYLVFRRFEDRFADLI